MLPGLASPHCVWRQSFWDQVPRARTLPSSVPSPDLLHPAAAAAPRVLFSVSLPAPFAPQACGGEKLSAGHCLPSSELVDSSLLCREQSVRVAGGGRETPPGQSKHWMEAHGGPRCVRCGGMGSPDSLSITEVPCTPSSPWVSTHSPAWIEVSELLRKPFCLRRTEARCLGSGF